MRRGMRATTLIVAGVLAGTMLLTPVGAHINNNAKHVGKETWSAFIKKAASKQFVKKCKDGSVLGYATVDADAGFSSTFTTAGVTAFNCTGGTVEVRRIIQGVPSYHVKFEDLGTTNELISNAQVTASQATAAFGVYLDDGTATDDSFVVRMFDAAGTGVDADFSLTIFRAA